MPTLATLRQRSCAIWVVDSIDLHKIMMRGGGPKRSDSGSRSNWPRRSMYAKPKKKKKKKYIILYKCPRPSASVRVRPRPSASVRVRRIHKACQRIAIHNFMCFLMASREIFGVNVEILSNCVLLALNSYSLIFKIADLASYCNLLRMYGILSMNVR